MLKPDVVIAGAGLAGLCCARKLRASGVTCRIVEASDDVGGRIRTDRHDGFLLDRGFQVLLTAYPEALAELDYDALDLQPFVPATLVRHNGEFHRFSDPARDPGSLFNNLLSPAVRLGDKFRLASLRRELQGRSVDEIFSRPETSTRQYLLRRKFSPRAIGRFFKPLLGGAMLDSKLVVSSRMSEFIFKMFTEGDLALPAQGMQAIPAQLAAGLGSGIIELNRRVRSVADGRLEMEDGETLEASSIVIATEGPEAARLLGYQRSVTSRAVCCLYFAAKEAPISEPILVLSGSARGPINNLAVPNLVAPEYAPPGQHLISVSLLGMPARDDQTIVAAVRSQLRRWFGLVADEWRLLRIYRIPHGLPVIPSLHRRQEPRVTPGLYVCGDHRSSPSIQGAMESGRLAAEAVLADLRGQPQSTPAPEARPHPQARTHSPGDSSLAQSA